MKQRTRPPFSFAGVWAWLMVATLAAALTAPRCLELTDMTLSPAPKPDGWQTWPRVELDMPHTRICDEHECGSLDGPLSCMHAPGSDLYVSYLWNYRGIEPKLEFHFAWRRVEERRLTFKFLPGRWGVRGRVILATIALELGILVAGLVAARRRLRTAARLARSVRDAYASVGSDGPAYRRASPGGAPQSAEACLAAGARGARRTLRVAYMAAFLVLGVFVAWAGWWVAHST